MAVWRGLINSCEKKRSKKQRRKENIYPSECRVFHPPDGIFIRYRKTSERLLVQLLSYSALCVKQWDIGWNSLYALHPVTKFTYEKCLLFIFFFVQLHEILVQFSSVTQPCPSLCNPMDFSTLGFSVHHQLPELTQTHVHWISDAIQPSHPLLSPSPPAFNISQHQGLFQWVSSWNQVTKILEFQLQHQSFQWIFRTDFL